jgi:hypothetical protein
MSASTPRSSGPEGTAADSPWPALRHDEWRDTQATLHRWTQVVGKIRLRQTPWVNHSWHVPLYLTSRGLTTTPIPHGSRTFEIAFDFIDHQLRIDASDGRTETIQLGPRAVADFYQEVFARLETLGLGVSIRTMPNEIPDAVPLDQDWKHASYDAEQVGRFWRALARADQVFKAFRARFIGKCSPVHFFWGSFDLAVTRFSGRPAPPHPGGIPNLPDWVAREAYSHEVSSCGFWPGGEAMPYPVFYSYAYPEPAGFNAASLRPASARYDPALGEFVLPYDDVRRAASSEATLLEFLQSSYEAAADLGGWDRGALERQGDGLRG